MVGLPRRESGAETTNAENRTFRRLLDGEEFIALDFALFDEAEHADQAVAADFAPVFVNDAAVHLAAVVATKEGQIVEFHAEWGRLREGEGGERQNEQSDQEVAMKFHHP